MTDFYAYTPFPSETGSTTDYAVSFPYIDEDDVKATVDGEEVDYTLPTSNIVRFDVAPTGFVEIYRSTNLSEPIVSYTDGSVEQAANFNLSNLQILYAMQEAYDRSLRSPFMQTGVVDFEGSRLVNASDPEADTDVATQGYVDTVIAAGIVTASDTASAAAALSTEAAEDAEAAAELSAADASASASAASSSASAAEAAKEGVLASATLDNYNHLGDATSHPTLNDEGGALAFGDWYFNTANEVTWFYTGTEWITYYASKTSRNKWTELSSMNASVQSTMEVALDADYQEFKIVARVLSDVATGADLHARFSVDTGVTYETTGYLSGFTDSETYLPLGDPSDINDNNALLVVVELSRLGTDMLLKSWSGDLADNNGCGVFESLVDADSIQLTLHKSGTPYDLSASTTLTLYGR